MSVDLAAKQDSIEHVSRERKLASFPAKKCSKLLCSFLRMLLGVSSLSFYLAASREEARAEIKDGERRAAAIS